MGKSYVDSDNFSKNFDEAVTDLKGGSVSKLHDLATDLNSIAKMSGESTYYILPQVLGTFSNMVMNSRKGLLTPYVSNDMKEKLVATINQRV